MRGIEGSKVRIRVMREGVNGREEFVVPITRKRVEFKDRAFMNYIGREVRGEKRIIGLLRLPSFYEKESLREDMVRLLTEAAEVGVSGIILDLSNNLGGSLSSSVVVAGAFIQSGVIMTVLSEAKEEIKRYVDRDVGDYSYYGPLVILTNQRTASASEIVSGTLRDYKRAVILGKGQTFGKGSAQVQFDFEGRFSGVARVTYGLFFTPSGRALQHHGVSSDIYLPGPDSSRKFEKNIRNSIPPPQDIEAFLSPSNYTGEGHVWKSLDESTVTYLREKSRLRIEKSREFQPYEGELSGGGEGGEEGEDSWSWLLSSGGAMSSGEREEYLRREDVQEAINIMFDYVAK